MIVLKELEIKAQDLRLTFMTFSIMPRIPSDSLKVTLLQQISDNNVSKFIGHE